jgi:hypothetical protein
MDETAEELDPRAEIERLEARIEELAARIESTRKFILTARIAVAAGLVLLAAITFGVVRFDPTLMATAVAAVLIGIVVWGSNQSTAKEATAELAETETNRKALIGLINLRLVAQRPTLH